MPEVNHRHKLEIVGIVVIGFLTTICGLSTIFIGTIPNLRVNVPNVVNGYVVNEPDTKVVSVNLGQLGPDNGLNQLSLLASISDDGPHLQITTNGGKVLLNK